MDDRALGRAFRSLRIRKGLRQVDVGRRATTSADAVSLLERGQLERLSFASIRRLWSALDVRADVEPRLSPAERAGLLDAGHASIVERVVDVYRSMGWEVVVEYTFNDYGERGAVDVLSWRLDRGALAVNEIKTKLADVQGVNSGVDRKARVVPRLVARERGWRPRWVGRVLIVADTRANRRVVASHAATFQTSFPARTREVQRWIATPGGPLSGLWFLSYPNETRHYASRERCRGRRTPITRSDEDA